MITEKTIRPVRGKPDWREGKEEDIVSMLKERTKI